MSSETAITWTVPNWITVFLMVFLGTVVVGAIAAAIANARKKASGQ